MKKALWAMLFGAAAIQGGTAQGLSPGDGLKRISWFGQDTLRIELAGKLIWIDPVQVSLSEKADIILVTHDHADHYSQSDVEKLRGPSTLLFLGFGTGPNRIKPGERKVFGSLEIGAVYAYNLVKTNYHPKAKEYCGFILSGEGLRIYVAGDSERIPEMKSISCDIALLPLGQTYTMGSVDEAALAAKDVKAKIAVPIHYGMYEGSQADANAFIAALAKLGMEGRLLPRGK